MRGMTKTQRARLRYAFRTLSILHKEVEDPEIKEYINQASLELMEIALLSKIPASIELQAMQMYYQGTSLKVIQFKLKITVHIMRYILSKHNLARKRSRKDPGHRFNETRVIE